MQAARLAIIGYDGSSEADAALAFAAGAIRAESWLVLTVWVAPVPARAPLAALPPQAVPVPEIDAPLRERARLTAEAGAELARAAGLTSRAEWRGAVTGDVGRTIVDAAEEHDADIVVIGRRGVGWLESALAGSVSTSVVRDGRRPVLVVPGPDA